MMGLQDSMCLRGTRREISMRPAKIHSHFTGRDIRGDGSGTLWYAPSGSKPYLRKFKRCPTYDDLVLSSHPYSLTGGQNMFFEKS